jgi:hypothetical protein
MMVLITTMDITAITNSKLIAKLEIASTYPGQKMSDASLDSEEPDMVEPFLYFHQREVGTS